MHLSIYRKIRTVFFLLFLLYLTYFISIALDGALINRAAPHWDYAFHLNNTFIYMPLIKSVNITKLLSIYTLYPPLVYMVMGFIFIAFGYSRINILLFNFSSLGITLLLCNKLIKDTTDSETSFRFSILLITMIINLSLWWAFKPWELMLDLPLLFLVILFSVFGYILYKNDKNTIKNATILGLLFSTSLLTKWSAMIYCAFPIFLLFIKWIRNRQIYLIAFFTLPLLFGSIWYFINIQKIINDLHNISVTTGFQENDPQSFSSILYYFKEFRFFFIPYLPIFICFMYYIWQFRKSLKNTLIKNTTFHWIAVTLLFPLLILFFLINNKDTRYIAPVFVVNILFIFLYLSTKKYSFIHIIIDYSFLIMSMVLLIQFKPYIDPNKSLLQRWDETLIQQKGIQRISYFFEYDSPSFNYANINLMHALHQYYKQPAPEYEYLNSFPGNFTHQCNISTNTQEIIVFSIQNMDDESAPKFTSECSKILKLIYKKDQLIKDREMLTIYRKL
jgi:hypothetical protein